MRKRAAVARALSLDPEILVFDEPSAGLDPIVAAELDEVILVLKRAFQMTVIVVTHELASAFWIADRNFVILTRQHAEEARDSHALSGIASRGGKPGRDPVEQTSPWIACRTRASMSVPSKPTCYLQSQE